MKDNYLYTIVTDINVNRRFFHPTFWVAFTEKELEKRLSFCKDHELTFKVETIRYELIQYGK